MEDERQQLFAFSVLALAVNQQFMRKSACSGVSVTSSTIDDRFDFKRGDQATSITSAARKWIPSCQEYREVLESIPGDSRLQSGDSVKI